VYDADTRALILNQLNSPLHGQSVKPTVLMLTERTLSPVRSDAVALDDVRMGSDGDGTAARLAAATQVARSRLQR